MSKRDIKQVTALLVFTGAFHLSGGIAAANRLVIAALQDAEFKLRIHALNESSDTPPNTVDSRNILSYKKYANSKSKFAFNIWISILIYRPQFIFCDHVNLASILAPLAALRLIKYHVRLNGIEVFTPLPDFEGKLGLKFGAVRLAISRYTMSRVQAQFPKFQVKYCPLSLPPTVDDLKKDSTFVPNMYLKALDNKEYLLGDQVILHVGRMASNEQYKGQDCLIKALSQILSRHPNAQLVLAGNGDDYQRLVNMSREISSKVQSAIFMPGYISDDNLSALYRLCYLFAMPSKGEGFGFVYVEAMRWGKPCVGSKLDAAAELIQDQINGLLVNNPDHIENLADTIVWLLDNPEVARQMGEAGKRQVESHYLFSHFKDRFLQAIVL